MVSKKGAFCEVREIAKRSHDTAFMQSEVSPKQNEFIGEPIKKKILDGYIMITSYIRATPHEYETLATGTKVYKRSYVSSYAWFKEAPQGAFLMPAGLVQIGSDQNHRKEKQPATAQIWSIQDTQ